MDISRIRDNFFATIIGSLVFLCLYCCKAKSGRGSSTTYPDALQVTTVAQWVPMQQNNPVQQYNPQTAFAPPPYPGLAQYPQRKQ